MRTKSRGTLTEIGEFGLIHALTNGLPIPGESVVLGIGDDAAAVDIGSGRYLLATCDIQIENIHFTRHGFTPEQIGWKAAAVNLSDIAAMGGTPRYALVSLAAPQDTPTDYLVQVYAGLGECLSKFGTAVIGGNTAENRGGLLLDVTLLGDVDKSFMLTRKGAEPGDLLCVTGSLGGSRAGLMLQSDNRISVGAQFRAAALKRHCAPQPRLHEAQIVAAHGASACMDVSDGLLGDVHHLADASGVRVEINTADVPVDAPADAVSAALGVDAAAFALEGGEDFELLFTVHRDRFAALAEAVRLRCDTPVTVIGEITEGSGVAIIQENGRSIDSSGGFDHFR